jgi:hypothetical protein
MSSQARMRNFAHRGYFIGGPVARIIEEDDRTTLPELWTKMHSEAQRDDLPDHFHAPLGVSAEEPNRRWYITGRMPADFYMVALCYATTVFLLVRLPWNVLLLLLLLPSRNKRLRETRPGSPL